MKFERIFTLSPMDEGILERRDAIIYGKGGITFEQKCVEVPKFWSDNALSIVASKYFKAGETSVKEIVKRVVDTIIMWGIRENYFDRESSEIFRDELSFIFINQYASPNSPVWFNLGVPGRSQVGSACFLLDVEDNMDSIRRWYALESKIFQAGSGAGVNVSKLRPANSPLSQGGTASGPISFMKAADSQAGIIKSGGKTRRAAKAILMNDDHPDLLDFIKCKYEEEEKARILVEAGYSDGIDGEAINTVSHQNANYSVVVTDQFMSNAAKDGTKESTILDKIAEAAWKCGDPGLLYRDTILKSYMIPACGEPVSVNPCQPDFATALTPAGIKTFAEINIGSIIWSGKQWTEVTNKRFTGIKPVNRYSTTAGSFIGTEEHQIIQNGERIQIKNAESIDAQIGRIYNDPLILLNDVMDGFILGDGTVHKASNNLVYGLFGQDDNDVLVALQDLIVKERIDAFKYGYEVITSITAEELPHTYLRKVPSRFRFGSPVKVCGFLRGLYTANGSICGNRITLKSASKSLIFQVQEMLSSIGISSYYTINKSHIVEFNNGEYECKESYDLNITRDRYKFATNIGFIQNYKTDRLNTLLATVKLSNRVKVSYDIKNIEYLGDFPVYDITVDAPEHTYWTGGLLVSNCFEIVSQPPFTACNLASINVLKFWDGGTFNWRLYRHVINIMTVALDIICYCADYPDEEIAKNTREQHHIGLGYTNIGSLLMSMGLAYDSYMGRKVVASLSSSLTGQAFLTSTYMSEELGSFIGYESNKNRIEEVLTSFMLKTKELGENWLDQLWLDLLNRTRKYGLRNANVTAIAPTGTISFMMDASTTGIEPELALIKYKTLVGGGTLTLVNPVVEAALRRLNYDQSSIDSIKQYITANNTVVGSDIKKEHESVFATSFGSNSLEPMAHVRMVAEAQKFITEGISKTCNLPKEATVQDVKKVYIEAWKLGTKAVAIYRDGSKSSQPLNIRKVTTKETKSMRQSLPDERQSITHKVDIGGLELYLHVGLDENGDPKELFIQGSKQGSSLQGLLDSFATSISYCLQYGVPLEILIEKFSNTRFEPSGFTQHSDIKVATSPVDYIFRWLKWKFVDKKGNSPSKVEISQLSGDVCKQCGGMLIRTGTCFTCSNCATPSGGCG